MLIASVLAVGGGMFTPTMDLCLSATDREELERVVRATSAPAGPTRRARCILLPADGYRSAEICLLLGVTDRFVARWIRRYLEAGVLALADAPRAGRQDHRVSARSVLRTPSIDSKSGEASC